ncbi:TerB family tellurite resistance protein [Streptomyces sp. BE20]|uniref:TerB family tellurite resistance protein n=1 Tax=unclassified Streptomyces TaxID=2593676 RepID=UPI002E784D5C|nr:MULTISPECIES: TerB family tellurite resistance protein [unclassified Streptomyces]MED7953336.1 TerB family tellurite resistance protein [Streptomyces sp. BE303]MEE1828686.1 TerB family tellurite resistance protein [Streptomyces sp. BE20]
MWGVRPRWRTDVLGDFYCPGCGGDRNYRRQHGRRWLRLLGTPVLPLGPVVGSVQCTSCHGRFGVESLEQPTCVRLGGMLRDAQYTVALVMLAAGGTAHRAAREAACAAVRDAGFEDCGEAQVLAALAALSGLGGELYEAHEVGGAPGDRLDDSGGLAVELHAVLEPLAPHLAHQGRERLLLQGAAIALADGRYRPQERDALAAVGRCLDLPQARVGVLLEAATRTSH